MERVFVSIGSNVDREHHIEIAVESLRARFGDLQLSSVYESAAVGFNGDPFFNLVVAFDSDAEPAEIVAELHEIERRCGRERDGERFGPRTMDLDLLLFGDRVVRDGDIVIPRAEVDSEAFVLCPLAEIAGERRHPVSGDTLASIWARLADRAGPLRRVEIRSPIRAQS
jgi:2-amino-4-hydroxy-6-hydroxymethyldihydropteridine diphosphokinase